AEPADPAIEAERALAEELGEAPDRRAAGQLHLEEPVVGVEPAERRRGVARRSGGDERDARGVEPDLDARAESADRRLPRPLRPPARAQPEKAARSGEGDDERETCENPGPAAESHGRGV